MLNVNKLENLAISTEVPVLGEIATLKEIGKKIVVTVNLYDNAIVDEISTLLLARLPSVELEINCQTEPKSVQPNVPVKKNINNIIAISSGKGGVGKSSTAVNLALAMAENGAKVGILDADIYGPSQPIMLGVDKSPKIIDEKTMIPNFMYNIESNSIGYLVDGDKAMIWRAPMIVRALQQLIDNTAWGSNFVDHKQNLCNKKEYLDYLFIDLPPGTGDISLSMAQKIPVTGAVTVTTPQDIALIDARRSINMFIKMQIDNLGIIENMSTYICEHCGQESHIFGNQGGHDFAKELDISLLGQIPLNKQLRQSLDNGKPIMIAQPNHPISKCYRKIAKRIAIILAKKPKNFSQAFGKIAVENK